MEFNHNSSKSNQNHINQPSSRVIKTPSPNIKVIIAGNHAAINKGICADDPKACRKFEAKNTKNPIPTPPKIKMKAPFVLGGLKETVAANKIIDINNKGWESND